MRQKAHWIELRENQMYHNNDNVINIIELYTLKGWSWEISCHTVFYHNGKLNNKLKIIAKESLYLKPWQQKPSKLKTEKNKNRDIYVSQQQCLLWKKLEKRMTGFFGENNSQMFSKFSSEYKPTYPRTQGTRNMRKLCYHTPIRFL